MAKLLLSVARTALSAYVKPPGASAAQVDAKLNQVAERFINGGKWRGTMTVVEIAVYDGQITLPNTVDTILGVSYAGRPSQVAPVWYQYLLNGPGEVALGFAGAGPIELADDRPVFRDPPGAVRLRAESAAAEAALAQIWVEALNAAGEDIYTPVGGTLVRGFPLVLGAALAGPQVTAIKGVVKPLTNGVVKLFMEDPATAGGTVIGIYQPSETVPAYRRFNVAAQEGASPIRVLGKRAHVPAVANYDVLTPGNLGAYKLGLMALNYEDANDHALADGYWLRAFDLLNKESREFFGPNAGKIQFIGNGYGSYGLGGLT